VPLYGDGLNVRDRLHVDDHCNGIALVLAGGRAGEVYNIGGGTELTNREITEQLLARAGRTGRRCSRCRTAWSRPPEQRRHLQDCLGVGYAPRVTFEQGLRDVVCVSRPRVACRGRRW
jgi:dTDP-glucose 4,6-dehydratase